MFCECEKRRDLRMPIVTLDFVSSVRCEAVSAIRRPESCGFSDGEKNILRRLRSSPSEFLRPQDAPDSGSLLWGYPRLFGSGDSSCPLQGLWFGEARAALLDIGESFLHEAICVLCRQALSSLCPSGRGKGVGFRLEDGQGVGEAIYAGTTQARRDTWAAGDWN